MRREASIFRDKVTLLERDAKNDIEILRKNARQDAKNARAEVNLARENFRNWRIEFEARAGRQLTESLKIAVLQASGAGEGLQS